MKSRLQILLLFFLGAVVPVAVMAQQAYPPVGSAFPPVALNGMPPSQEPPPNPPDQQSAWNTELAGANDLQGRSAYQPIIINQDGREIAYVGHHTGAMMNPLTGVVEPNGTSIVDVTDPTKTKYLSHIPGSSEGGEEEGGAQMVRVCSGSVLPHGVKGKWYLLRPNGSTQHEVWDVTDPAKPTLLTVVVKDLNGTHKSWWECDTGIAYLVANRRSEGWTGGNHMKIYDLMFCPDGVSHPPGDPKINSECQKVIQTNNVEVDDRGFIYSTDRAGTGLHIIRLTGRAKDAVTPAK